MPPDVGSGADRVSIRPGSRVLSTFRHLNYKPWFALAEFVDNSLQSYLANRDRLAAATGRRQVSVSIEAQSTAPTRITVRDDAAGIAASDYSRAFQPAAIPADAAGLSEFGMGLKSAACWFAPRWSVRSSALGEPVVRTVRLDIAEIASTGIEEVPVEEAPGPAGTHFTEVVLDDPYVLLRGATLGKVRDHLADIYRCFIRENTLALRVNGQLLEHREPQVLRAPWYRDPSSAPLLWRKAVDLDLGGGQRARGFAALRQEGKATEAGFALFRRKRLIQGSADEGWKHPEVFGSPNSYRGQRLFGELHLDGFEVSHTKDGFRWPDEAEFAQLLAEELDRGDLPLLKQAEGYRQREARPVILRSAAAAVAGTHEDMERGLADAMPPAAEQAAAADPPTDEPPRRGPAPLADRELSFDFRGSRWTVSVRVMGDGAQGEWLEIGDAESGRDGRRIEVRVAGDHPFMARFAHRDPEVMQALVRVAASLGIAEALLRSTGAERPAAIRRTANELLLDVFSQL